HIPVATACEEHACGEANPKCEKTHHIRSNRPLYELAADRYRDPAIHPREDTVSRLYQPLIELPLGGNALLRRVHTLPAVFLYGPAVYGIFLRKQSVQVLDIIYFARESLSDPHCGSTRQGPDTNRAVVRLQCQDILVPVPLNGFAQQRRMICGVPGDYTQVIVSQFKGDLFQ